MEYPDIVEGILGLFEIDNGVRITVAGRAYVLGLWKNVPPASKSFLAGLTPEDLSNVCIGEQQELIPGSPTWNYRGTWQPLPNDVEKFLSDIWEMVEDSDPDFVEV